MWTDIKRIIKSGFVNFWRNSFVSLASILVMTVTLFVLGSLLFVGVMLESSLAQIKDKVDINVYFVTEAPEEEILTLKTSLETLPEVRSVEYVSRTDALERFKTRHENDQLTLQALEELGENPLGANLNIKAVETSQYKGIAAFLQSDSALAQDKTNIIDKVNYFQNKAAIDNLTKIIESSETFGFLVTIILVIATVIITFNTVRLAIYTSKDEIAVMQLVGANNSYIRGPFVFEGILYGAAAGFLTLIFLYPLTIWLGPVTERFFGNINIFTYFVGNFGRIFVIIVGSGIILGAISSFLAVRKYLKV